MLNFLMMIIMAGIGAVLRDFITEKMNIKRHGTLIVNVIGAFLSGVVFNSFMYSGNIYNLFTLGFLGGFTTYSTFTKEQYLLLSSKQYSKFFMYTLSTFLLILIAFFIGAILSR